MSAFQADFTSKPLNIEAGNPAVLVFSIHDADSNILNRMKITHEKPAHLIIVSEDLFEFYHLHPEQDERGNFISNHIFPWGGTYRLYLDFTPVNAEQTVASFQINVYGPMRSKVDPGQDLTLTRETDGIRVTAGYEKPLQAEKEVTLTFEVTDPLNNRPVTDLQPYLGASAHIIIISYPTGELLHVHPLDRKDTHHMHALPNSPHSPATSNIIRAGTRFPVQGKYKLWAQFKRHNKVITVPFVLDVASSSFPTAT